MPIARRAPPAVIALTETQEPPIRGGSEAPGGATSGRRGDRDLALCDSKTAQPCENPYLTVLPWLNPWLTLRMAPPRVCPNDLLGY